MLACRLYKHTTEIVSECPEMIEACCTLEGEAKSNIVYCLMLIMSRPYTILLVLIPHTSLLSYVHVLHILLNLVLPSQQSSQYSLHS